MPYANFSLLTLLLCLTCGPVLLGQLATITPLEPAKAHYARLQQLPATPSSDTASVDTVRYPPEKYRNNTLLFALTRPVYLSPEQVEYLIGAVEPPANSSVQTQAELDFLLDLQQRRSEAEIARTNEIARIGYWPDANHLTTHPSYQKNLRALFFECREVVGEDCTAERYPHTTKLLQGVMNDMRLMEFAVKYQKLRPRPYHLEPHIKPLREISSPSFASGHTLWAYLQALTFGELMPERRAEFVELAYEIGYSRELMGVHYPSDEETARQLAHRMLYLMWHTGSFQQDFLAARGEWIE